MIVNNSPCYKCEICGNSYSDEELAVKCEEYGKFLKEHKEIEPWQWIEFTGHHPDVDIENRFYFFFRVLNDTSGCYGNFHNLSYYNNQDNTTPCLSRSINLYGTEYHSYSTISFENFKNIKFHSIEEAFKINSRIILHFSFTPSHVIPDEIKERVNSLYSSHNKEILDYLHSLNPEFIIDKIYNLIKEDCFSEDSFSNFVVKSRKYWLEDYKRG